MQIIDVIKELEEIRNGLTSEHANKIQMLIGKLSSPGMLAAKEAAEGGSFGKGKDERGKTTIERVAEQPLPTGQMPSDREVEIGS